MTLHAPGGRRRKTLEREVGAFFAAGGKGLNITVPHKQAACLVTRYRTPRAEIARAVNTLALRRAMACSATTPMAPAWSPISRAISVFDTRRHSHPAAWRRRRRTRRDRSAARRRAGVHRDRQSQRRARASNSREEFATLGDVRGCGFDGISDGVFDLVLNATSASLQDDDSARFRRAVIGPATLCYDMAYGKGDTAFTRWAKSAGAGRAETGWGMLVEQAAEAFVLWRGVKPDTKPVLDAVKAQRIASGAGRFRCRPLRTAALQVLVLHLDVVRGRIRQELDLLLRQLAHSSRGAADIQPAALQPLARRARRCRRRSSRDLPSPRCRAGSSPCRSGRRCRWCRHATSRDGPTVTSEPMIKARPPGAYGPSCVTCSTEPS